MLPLFTLWGITMEQQEPETPSQQRAPTPLRITERTLGHGLMAALVMQYAIGRST